MKIRIGTRGSELALWQAYHIHDLLKERNPELELEIVKIKTTGDKILDSPLSKIGDKGLFTKELDVALLENRIDIAVHSMKDVPTAIPEDLTIAAIPLRGVVEDVFVSNTFSSLDEVPHGGIIATGSLRRKSQLLALRPDLQIVDLRGNVNTRLNKLDLSEWHGMILARAGLERLGFHSRIRQVFPATMMIPAVGQGALAVVCRKRDSNLLEILQKNLHHHHTAMAVMAERAFLRTLEGGCQIPIGCHGMVDKSGLHLHGFIGDLEGKSFFRHSITGNTENAEELGEKLASTMLDMGAGRVLEQIRKVNK